MRSVPLWWKTVEVGDKLREVDHAGDRLLHIVCIFEDRRRRFIVTKEWWQTKQHWHYEVQHETKAMVGMIYLDGQARPE